MSIEMTELKPSERKRTYSFPSGNRYEFENVTHLEVRESGKHRIQCANGRKAFVNTGWEVLEVDVDEWTV